MKERQYLVVQPWGKDRARQATVVSSHPTASAAFAAIDRVAAQMVRTGCRADAVVLIVVDRSLGIVRRPES